MKLRSEREAAEKAKLRALIAEMSSPIGAALGLNAATPSSTADLPGNKATGQLVLGPKTSSFGRGAETPSGRSERSYKSEGLQFGPQTPRPQARLSVTDDLLLKALGKLEDDWWLRRPGAEETTTGVDSSGSGNNSDSPSTSNSNTSNSNNSKENYKSRAVGLGNSTPRPSSLMLEPLTKHTSNKWLNKFADPETGIALTFNYNMNFPSQNYNYPIEPPKTSSEKKKRLKLINQQMAPEITEDETDPFNREGASRERLYRYRLGGFRRGL
ncbi:unnamed protein product [Amoebophrya sp. A120]|nr:unnamed protein product [Amoebophrya sp. A120]|eukprot:GSA120T00022776001.1